MQNTRNASRGRHYDFTSVNYHARSPRNSFRRVFVEDGREILARFPSWPSITRLFADRGARPAIVTRVCYARLDYALNLLDRSALGVHNDLET